MVGCEWPGVLKSVMFGNICHAQVSRVLRMMNYLTGILKNTIVNKHVGFSLGSGGEGLYYAMTVIKYRVTIYFTIFVLKCRVAVPYI